MVEFQKLAKLSPEGALILDWLAKHRWDATKGVAPLPSLFSERPNLSPVQAERHLRCLDAAGCVEVQVVRHDPKVDPATLASSWFRPVHEGNESGETWDKLIALAHEDSQNPPGIDAKLIEDSGRDISAAEFWTGMSRAFSPLIRITQEGRTQLALRTDAKNEPEEDALWVSSKHILEKGYVSGKGQLTKLAKKNPQVRREATPDDRTRLNEPRIHYVYSSRQIYELTEGRPED